MNIARQVHLGNLRHRPEESLSGKPNLILLHSLPGEEKKQKHHGDCDCGSTPSAEQGTQTVHPMYHQNTVAHTAKKE